MKDSGYKIPHMSPTLHDIYKQAVNEFKESKIMHKKITSAKIPGKGVVDKFPDSFVVDGVHGQICPYGDRIYFFYLERMGSIIDLEVKCIDITDRFEDIEFTTKFTQPDRKGI